MENKVYDYGCVMLKLPVLANVWDEIQSFVNNEDIYNKDDLGRENDPHITLLYGIHSDVSDETIIKTINEFNKEQIILNELECFENDEYDVLIFKITNNKNLYLYNNILKQLPHTSSYPDYKPHCTISYLKKGTAKKYTGKLDVIYRVKSNIVSYSKPNGEKHYYKIG